ncbi:MAG: DNA-methyltransferase [Candidatus Hodarchaeota archaeon]
MIEIRFKIGDSRELLKKVPAESMDLVVTSPPYNLGKPYGKYHDKIPLEKWINLIHDVSKEIYRVLTPNGSFFLNLSPVPVGSSKEIIPLSNISYPILKEIGFLLRNSIIWHFNNMQNCTKRLSGRWESIHWWVKDLTNYVFNLDAVRIPYLTKGDKRIERRGGSGRNPTDVWFFDRINNMTKKKLGLAHPTIFPLSMIERIIKMASHKEAQILDPFVGSGTTLVAAAKLQRNALGFEIDSQYKSLICKRVENETANSIASPFRFKGPGISKIVGRPNTTC